MKLSRNHIKVAILINSANIENVAIVVLWRSQKRNILRYEKSRESRKFSLFYSDEHPVEKETWKRLKLNEFEDCIYEASPKIYLRTFSASSWVLPPPSCHLVWIMGLFLVIPVQCGAATPSGKIQPRVEVWAGKFQIKFFEWERKSFPLRIQFC